MEVDRAQDETPTPGGLEPGASEHSDVIPAGSEPRGQATPEAASIELEPIDDDPDDVDDDLDDSGDGLDDSGADVGADDSLPRLDAESPAAVAMPKTPVRGTALTDARPTDAPHAPAAAHPAAAAPARTAEAPAPAPAGERIPLMGLGARAWKQVTFELLNLPLGIAGFVCMVVLLSVGSGLAITIIGLPLLAIALAVCRAWGRVDRARARALLGLQIASPSKMPVRESGFFGWLWTRLADPVGWRSALYLLIRLPWGILSFTVTLTLLVAFWPVVPYVVYGFAAVDRAMISALLSPSSATERRIRELEARRETMVGAAADDRRRIERDLHDGAQARLVALAMDLGLTKERMAQDPEVAAQMIEQAHGEVKVALRELRDLARGIHPAILTERGLGAALTNVAGRCTVPVTVSVDLPTHRPSAAVEGLVYFTASELLTNISKHSGARAASIRLIRAGDRLQLTVTDDGRGGATIAPGGGLAGLAERVGAMDGRFTLTSPPGGPTVATARLPWQDVGAGPSSSGKEARRAAHEARHERQHERQDARRAAQEARHVQRDAERDAAQRGDA
ncbi:sensor domain-containing protein [Pseudofrankia sp. BMG5.37]|nr:sensor domain-containing protein [Pseudofrankia sp. BMG5.37]MDT3444324.1 sensor domain-containing protein [Pseudofrankia sp. BMG5.37]